MKTKEGFQKYFPLVLLAALLLVTLLARSAPAVGQNDPQVEAGVALAAPALSLSAAAVPPQMGSGVIVIGAEAFEPYYQSTTYQRSDLLLRVTSAGTAPFDAPVHIPNGATINQMVVYFMDNDAVANLSVYFVKHNLTSSIGIASTTVASSGASGTVRYVTTTAFTEPVDAGSNHYFVRVNLPGGTNVSLNAVRIDYSFDTNLPLVNR